MQWWERIQWIIIYIFCQFSKLHLKDKVLEPYANVLSFSFPLCGAFFMGHCPKLDIQKSVVSDL